MRFCSNVNPSKVSHFLEKQEMIDKDNQVLLKKLVEIQAGKGVSAMRQSFLFRTCFPRVIQQYNLRSILGQKVCISTQESWKWKESKEKT